MELARYHRLRAPYYRLEGQRCCACGKVQFPPRPACRACGQATLEPHRLSGRGTVYSHAEVGQAPRGFAAPYVVALVRLEEGLLVTAQLTDVEASEVTIGLPVEMVTRRLQEQGSQGYLVYGYKFRPVAPARRPS
jgi:uncharacterized OB-fold protein